MNVFPSPNKDSNRSDNMKYFRLQNMYFIMNFGSWPSFRWTSHKTEVDDQDNLRSIPELDLFWKNRICGLNPKITSSWKTRNSNYLSDRLLVFHLVALWYRMELVEVIFSMLSGNFVPIYICCWFSIKVTAAHFLLFLLIKPSTFNSPITN